MFSEQVWNSIDKAALKRAQYINTCYKYWNSMYDSRCTDIHTSSALEIQQTYPELEGFSIATVKEMISTCSEEYVVPEAKEYLNI